MALFPEYDTIGYVNPLVITLNFKTLTSQFDEEGEEKRRRKWLYTKRDITLSYQYISRQDMRMIWQFYQARYGSYQAFNFFLPYADETYVGEYVGTGDGTTVIFNLPSKNASGKIVYIDSSETEETTDYTYTAVGGTDGADKIEFVVAPNDGERITFDFAGILKTRCRFMDDNLSFEQMYNKFNTVGVKLKGLLNE